MRKVGRNDPCPCGSGTKYKKCHGKDPDNAPLPKAATNTAPLQCAIPNNGLPGLLEHVAIVPCFNDDGDPRNSKDGQGQPGEYEIILTLSHPGSHLRRNHNITSNDQLHGDSHLGIVRPAHAIADVGVCALKIDVSINGHRYTFKGSPNTDGFLSKITGSFHANNFADAYRMGMAAVAPTLSHWSAQLDIPLYVSQTDIIEKRCGARRITFRSMYRDTPLIGVSESALCPEFRGYASVYREALNSSSSAYQFLCFFKIAESVYARRGRQAQERKERGETSRIKRPFEKFPTNRDALISWLNSLYPVRPHSWNTLLLESLLSSEVAGRSFKGICDAYLRPLRDQIAHALFGSMETGKEKELNLSTDDPLSHDEVDKWLPVAKCLVRRMLKNEFRATFLTGIPDPPESSHAA